ncbi:NADH-quinone oxidoreductase subunit L [Candidatus Phycosocius spiralis]|uniref:NADH:ubiquinone oxidoreductase subunit L n=1 Tax=Candidatus Phycosocius spiralis TaxID=2815099 RepID=A0ABQ4PSY8_9PROT|nr:NADH-quinone oxidoreductase subunit L [Candidatus Phycosocius spiralis]GIU66104.1 NADH:ubiquinone oxidoreductase subunit L [Candidatus Phycosocius spiralis]
MSAEPHAAFGLTETLATIVVFAPLLGALVCGLFNRFIGEKVAMFVATALLFVAAGCAATLFIGHWQHNLHLPSEPIAIATWIHVGDFKSTWSIRIDAISAVMMIVVTGVSALVHLYSWGYMAEDPHKPRFFAYLSLFTFAMLALVTAADFMQLFFGWEGVGLASYLLIGFWYHKRSANDAQIKAFVVNRVGDFGFVLGIMAVFFVFGTIEFKDVFALVPEKAAVMLKWGSYQFPAIEIIAFLLFIGAMGKSAQFFLHTWLPDAMEGPTPVSALIHAATMVTAGVVLVCLCSPIYEAAPMTAGFITMIGAVTALFAATVGLAQNDIKRVIAYSTCSQLGFMFFAAGIGAYQAAMFHLFTHAFFKALLFLGAGSVIHGMNHEQDMRKMGDLAKHMKITFVIMIIGTLAITGVGIPHTPLGFAGFFSKDAILETTFAAGMTGNGAAQAAFWMALLAATLTSFYSWRLAFMTFSGSPKWHVTAASGHDDLSQRDYNHTDHGHHAWHGPHESPWVMLIPLILLALGAVFAGSIFYDAFVGHHAKEFWGSAIYTAPDNTVLKDKYDVPHWVFYAPLVVMVVGLGAALYFYFFNEDLGKKIADRKRLAHAFLQNKWYFDELYEIIFVKAARVLGDFFWKIGDGKIIDGLGPNGIAGTLNFGSKKAVKIQSGYVYHYAFLMLIAVVALGALVLLRGA